VGGGDTPEHTTKDIATFTRGACTAFVKCTTVVATRYLALLTEKGYRSNASA
jgi:hypothetical protein